MVRKSPWKAKQNLRKMILKKGLCKFPLNHLRSEISIVKNCTAFPDVMHQGDCCIP